MPERYLNKFENTNDLLIGRILDDTYTHQDVIQFINLCTSISAAYLKNELYYNRIYFPIVQDNNSELKDISLDLIAPLFERDSTNSFKIFQNQLILDSQPESLLYRLKSIIINKTRQELIQRFKEEEPGGYKILRNIKLAPSRNKAIGKFEDQFNTYLYYCENKHSEPVLDHLHAELPEIDQDELKELALQATKNDTVIPKILENILARYQIKSCLPGFY